MVLLRCVVYDCTNTHQQNEGTEKTFDFLFTAPCRFDQAHKKIAEFFYRGISLVNVLGATQTKFIFRVLFIHSNRQEQMTIAFHE